MTVVWSVREWAEAIACVPVTLPLPRRTVLVPDQPVAHVLKRELIEAGQPQALAGTLFVTPQAAAAALDEEAANPVDIIDSQDGRAAEDADRGRLPGIRGPGLDLRRAASRRRRGREPQRQMRTALHGGRNHPMDAEFPAFGADREPQPAS
jgi:hypothetical protein